MFLFPADAQTLLSHNWPDVITWREHGIGANNMNVSLLVARVSKLFTIFWSPHEHSPISQVTLTIPMTRCVMVKKNTIANRQFSFSWRRRRPPDSLPKPPNVEDLETKASWDQQLEDRGVVRSSNGTGWDAVFMLNWWFDAMFIVHAIAMLQVWRNDLLMLVQFFFKFVLVGRKWRGAAHCCYDAAMLLLDVFVMLRWRCNAAVVMLQCCCLMLPSYYHTIHTCHSICQVFLLPSLWFFFFLVSPSSISPSHFAYEFLFLLYCCRLSFLYSTFGVFLRSIIAPAVMVYHKCFSF